MVNVQGKARAREKSWGVQEQLWWNPGFIVGFHEASLDRDEPKRIL
jgi:hypothetical protein